MAKIIIGQYEGTGLVSSLIKWRTWSDISHTAAIDGERTIEAWNGRVTCQGINEGHHKGTKINLYSIECSDEQRRLFYEFMYSKVGRKYDFLGIVGFALRVKTQNSENFFCSELVFSAAEYAGIELLKRIKAYQVSPGGLNVSPLLDYIGSIVTT